VFPYGTRGKNDFDRMGTDPTDTISPDEAGSQTSGAGAFEHMLLIFPPISKPCEPPAGIARLAGMLKANQLPCTVWDANLDCIDTVLQQPRAWTEKRYRDAARQSQKNIQRLKDRATYSNPDRYILSVKQLNLNLEKSGEPFQVKMGLADFEHRRFSPVRKSDLLVAAEHPETNPFYPYLKERLLLLLEKEYTDAIGFSLIFLSQALTTFAMIGILRKTVPEIKILLGGGLVTSWLRNTGTENPFPGWVDACIAGPGEKALMTWYGRMEASWSYGIPDYSDFPDSKYLSPGRILPYNLTYGCFWRKCSFCPESAEGNPHCTASPDPPLKGLQALNQSTRPDLIHVLDNAIPPAFLAEMGRGEPIARWYGYVRFSRELEDADFCIALKKSGCVMLQVGLESGNQKVLDGMNKGITIQSATAILKNLKAAGIAAYVYLLFGTPHEDETAARQTMAFVLEHAPAIQFMNAAIFNMPVRSSESDRFRTQPFYEGDLPLYTDFEHPAGWHRRKVRDFLDREFKRHPAIAEILHRTPPVFTSNHAPFFLPAFHRLAGR